ncbi:metallophosphoesterase [Oceanobacillus sp. 1P07AA]|uniref:metallophosphoesterase n=1 Tax=Oceanobacillus sp. 1P07AA TaxID=3132293 RepID=UPI0039A55FC6
MIDIRKLSLEPLRRVIVISDIHASLALFKKLLKKVNYTEEDYLFVNGDLCEKGLNSHELVHYVQWMDKNLKRVFITKGNCDVVFRHVFRGNDIGREYLNTRPKSMMHEMIASTGQSFSDEMPLTKASSIFEDNFEQEIEWLESLPIAYETDDFIIVHAAVDEQWPNTEEAAALYTPAFYEKGHSLDKPVIVGHWPVINYRTKQVSTHNPIIDFDNNIIAIDGGNQIKISGQLNALIINQGEYSFTYVDELKDPVIVKQTHNDSLRWIGSVNYPYYQIEPIEKARYFTRCKNINANIEQWVKNEYIIEKDDGYYCKEGVSTTTVSVNKGEKVYILDDIYDGYVLIKKHNGIIGWIPKFCVW